jgi:hypothetical protein
VAKLAHRLTVTIERVQFTDCDVRLAAGRSLRVRFATPSESNDPLVQAVVNGSWQPTDAHRWLPSLRRAVRALDADPDPLVAYARK